MESHRGALGLGPVELKTVGGQVVLGDEVLGELKNGRYYFPFFRLSKVGFVKWLVGWLGHNDEVEVA